MPSQPRVFVAGHRGLVGSALVRALEKKSEDASRLLLKSRAELDLLDQRAVHAFFKNERPDLVYVAAARVGGIYANSSHQADFLYENLVIAANVIHAAAESGVQKLLFLGSSCIYPRGARQPMTEDSLLTGPLESTNEGYAIAKIAGLKLCEYFNKQYGHRFISAMPTNLYGPGDNFHPEYSHVIPGMMRRFHEAKTQGLAEVKVWGSGRPKREFLHVDDLAQALLVLMDQYEAPATINVGSGREIAIGELARLMADVVGYRGKITFDESKPDGTPQKLLDVSRVRALGWNDTIDLPSGLRSTYEWATRNHVFAR